MLREIAMPAAGDDARAVAAIERVASGMETGWASDDQDAAGAAAIDAARAAGAAGAAGAASDAAYQRMAGKLIDLMAAAPVSTGEA